MTNVFVTAASWSVMVDSLFVLLLLLLLFVVVKVEASHFDFSTPSDSKQCVPSCHYPGQIIGRRLYGGAATDGCRL